MTADKFDLCGKKTKTNWRTLNKKKRLSFEDNRQYFIEVRLRRNSIDAPESDLSINVIIMYNKMRYQSINSRYKRVSLSYFFASKRLKAPAIAWTTQGDCDASLCRQCFILSLVCFVILFFCVSIAKDILKIRLLLSTLKLNVLSLRFCVCFIEYWVICWLANFFLSLSHVFLFFFSSLSFHFFIFPIFNRKSP